MNDGRRGRIVGRRRRRARVAAAAAVGVGVGVVVVVVRRGALSIVVLIDDPTRRLLTLEEPLARLVAHVAARVEVQLLAWGE